MGSGTLRFAGCFAIAVCGMAAALACGSSDESAFGGVGSFDAGGSSSSGSSGNMADGGTPQDAAPTMIPANGIVIVHAADFGAFRLCFKNEGARRPIPSADLLPESNLVGVDVGSAVRIDPIQGSPGTVYAFAVDDIKDFYEPGKPGPTCGELIVNPSIFQLAHEVATIDTILATGVHVLVLRGSLDDQSLRLENVRLNAFNRPFNTLPVQVIQLARNLEARAGNRKIGVAAGLVADAGDAGLDIVVEGSFEAGVPTPSMPVALDFMPNDEGTYATSGFLVTLGGPLDAGTDAGDGGPRQVILSQSLADIQRMSAPRALPRPWFNAGSSYVLLLLGNAQETDAAADELERLHFLAVPVAGPPSSDAGEPSDASTD